jgi:hypothetical protein
MPQAVLLGSSAVVALAAAATGLALLRGERLARSRRRLAAGVVAVALTAIPFLLPTGALVLRAMAAGFAVALSLKALLLVGRRDLDPEMGRTWPRFVLWLLVPPATRWPRTADEARAHRGEGLRRLARGVGKALLLLALVFIKVHVVPPAARFALEPFEFYLFLSGLADAVTAGPLLGGIGVAPSFRSPFLARTPGEFWARRWNLFVERVLRAYVFAPVARRAGAVAGLVAAFGASGAGHELLALACVGPARYRPGLELLFFLLQAVAVLLVRGSGTGRLGRVVGPLFVSAWLVATSPLFFLPLAPLVAGVDAACLAVVGRLVPGQGT